MRTHTLIGAAILATFAGMPFAFAASPPPAFSQPLDLSFGLLPPPAEHPMVKSSTFAAAPVPNLDEDAPTLRALGPAQAELSPGLFNTKHTYRGEGFTAGSTSLGEQQKRFKPTPGVNLSVPLE